MEEFKAKLLIDEYAKKCTRNGRFPIILNISNYMLIFFAFLAFFELFSLMAFYNIYIYLIIWSSAIIFIFICLYVAIYYKTRKSLIKRKLTKKEKKMLPLEYKKFLYDVKSKNKFFYIKDCFFKNTVDLVYHYIKLIDILEEKKINFTSNDIKSLFLNVKKNIPKSNKYQKTINLAIVGTISYPGLEPVYKYLANIYISENSTKFVLNNVSYYGIMILLVIFIVSIICKLTIFIEKKVLMSESEKKYILKL